MSEADRLLRICIDRLQREKTYSTAAAARGSIKAILRLDKLKPLDIPHILPFVMDGLKARAKAYGGVSEDSPLGLRQHDFARIDSSFGRLIYAPVALDEAPGTIRLPPVDMTLPELQRHIALKERKAEQTQANAEILNRFIEAHPDWADYPTLTLGQILRRDLDATNAA